MNALARRSLWLFIVGGLCLIGAVSLTVQADRAVNRERALADTLSALVEQLDGELRTARTNLDSATLQREIAGRREGVASARYHLAGGERHRAGLWKWNGVGTVLTVAGVLLLTGGVLARRSTRSG